MRNLDRVSLWQQKLILLKDDPLVVSSFKHILECEWRFLYLWLDVEDLLDLVYDAFVGSMLTRVLAFLISSATIQVFVNLVSLLVLYFRHSFLYLIFLLIFILRLELMPAVVRLALHSSFLFLLTMHLSQLREEL